MQPRLLDGAPPGTQGTCTPIGWTSGDVFLDWMHFFVEHVRPSADKKVLLLVDNHESHKYYPALEYAKIVLAPGKATICELSKPQPQVSVAPIVVFQESTKTSENIIHSEVCSIITLEPETVSLKASSTLEPDATNINVMHLLKSDALLPGTSKNTRRYVDRDDPPNLEPGCSNFHYSLVVLRPIPNPDKRITTRKRKLQKSEILTSTPIKEEQKLKFEKKMQLII
ncbi:unnamed protein product [Parnassius apollo]|uniref:(apollo) hypothetical protein n=1 Tax=Parnassius apollo TaxID=110799 RepID=A0A8S3VZG0_PARAO|nr:unnamed protein product [Parnassius apollo]